MKFRDTKVKKRVTRRYIILRNICTNLAPTDSDGFVVTVTRAAKYQLLMCSVPSAGIKL
jgi:hypothetical protein